MEKSFGLFFHLKKDKNPASQELIIYMRITVNRKSCEISTRRKCEISRWNVAAGRVEGRTEFAKSVNAELDVLQRQVFEKRKILIDNNREVSAENIKMLMQGGEFDQPKNMLMEIFKQHNNQMAQLVGSEYSASTLERYTTSYKHTLAFLQCKYQITDIDITKLNFEFITEYEFWLKSVRKCDHNTTMKYLSNFRKIINCCIRYGLLPADPFALFKMTKREVERTALTEAELTTLTEKHFPADRLSVVRDIFLFSCYTGLAYIDVKKLKYPDIFTGVDGEQWLISKRQKTDTLARIPLLPPALIIIERYKSHPQCSLEGKVLPVLTNQKMNAYLKEIADLCGIAKNLTYHIARHTFATTVTLSNGIPFETVSKMLGHRNLRTTQQYAKVLDIKVSEDMKMLRQKMLLKK